METHDKSGCPLTMSGVRGLLQVLKSEVFSSIRINDYPVDMAVIDAGRALRIQVEHNVQLFPTAGHRPANLTGGSLPPHMPHHCTYTFRPLPTRPDSLHRCAARGGGSKALLGSRTSDWGAALRGTPQLAGVGRRPV